MDSLSPRRGDGLVSHKALDTIVGRLALAIALAIGLTIPAGYAGLKYWEIAERLEFLAEIKSHEITRGLIQRNPQFWPYQVLRLEDLLSAEPRFTADEAFAVLDTTQKVLVKAGNPPAPPVVRRSRPLYESGRIVGHVEVQQSLRRWLYGTALAAWLGLSLGAIAFVTLRSLAKRAVRQVTDALENNASSLWETVQAQEAEFAARRKIEIELRDSEESYRKLFELSPDGMLIYRDGKVVMVNAECMRMFRATTVEQIVGRQVEDLFHADHRTRLAERMRQLDRENRALPAEEQQIVALDGLGTPVEVSAAPYTHAGIPGVQVVIRDITEKKKADERLNASRNTTR